MLRKFALAVVPLIAITAGLLALPASSTPKAQAAADTAAMRIVRGKENSMDDMSITLCPY